MHIYKIEGFHNKSRKVMFLSVFFQEVFPCCCCCCLSCNQCSILAWVVEEILAFYLKLCRPAYFVKLLNYCLTLAMSSGRFLQIMSFNLMTPSRTVFLICRVTCIAYMYVKCMVVCMN